MYVGKETLPHWDPYLKKGWNGPYVQKKEMLMDPWGAPYHYRSPGQHGAFDLFSLGADKQEGGEDENKDIVSW